MTAAPSCDLFPAGKVEAWISARRQLNLDPVESAVRRDEAMDRVEAHAEREDPGWQDRALEFLIALPKQEFMIEEVRAFAYERGLPNPPNEKAWGPVAKAAQRRGLVEFVRYDRVRSAVAHRRIQSVWRKL